MQFELEFPNYSINILYGIIDWVAWESRNNALWDTLTHAIFDQERSQSCLLR